MKTLPLGGTKGKNKVVIFDDEYYDDFSQYSWTLNSGYAVRGTSSGGPKRFIMHRLIMNTPNGMETDHINGDRLDNRKENLRVVTRTQNQMNRRVQKNNKSGYKGVTWCKRTEKWIVQIRVDTKTKFLGYYDNSKDGAVKYNEAAQEYFGEFAKLNEV